MSKVDIGPDTTRSRRVRQRVAAWAPFRILWPPRPRRDR